MQATIEQAQRKVDAIDTRIDAVKAELIRRSKPFNEMSAREWQRAWDGYPGLRGIERSLYQRRYDAQTALSELQFKAARYAERRANREFAKQAANRCRCCGHALAA